MKTIYVDSRTGILVENFWPPRDESATALAKSAEEVLDALTSPKEKIPVVPAEFGLDEVYRALGTDSSTASRTRR